MFANGIDKGQNGSSGALGLKKRENNTEGQPMKQALHNMENHLLRVMKDSLAVEEMMAFPRVAQEHCLRHQLL